MGKLIDRPARAPATVPLLHEGDRLTAREYLRRYEADPVVTRAELIDGVVYVNAVRRPDGTGESVSPISAEFHADPQGAVIGMFYWYAVNTPGVAGTGPVTLLVDDRNLPEPDAVLRVLPEYGGATSLNRRGYVLGPPELLVEVAHTSVARDMGPKYRAYEAGGVAEYLVWRTSRGKIDLFALRRGAYSAVAPDAAGVVRSGQFPGLWLDSAALLAGDNRRALETLQAGLASPEHAAFVAKLAVRAKRKRK
jgi:hypothetical protein